MIQCLYFNIYSLSENVIFYKYLPYSTSNVKLTEEPLEQPNHADKNSAQRFDNL